MAQQPPRSYQPGELSPDQQHYWDGQRWLSTMSPDGSHRWDGKAWIPVGPAAVTMVTPKKGGKTKWIVGAVVAIVALGVCSTAIAQGGSSNKTASTSNGSQHSAITPAPTSTPAAKTPDPRGTCAPQPCANDSYGWIVNVSNVKYDAPSGNEFEKPEAGNVYVQMNVTFTNKRSTEQNANPVNFVLLDGAGIKHTVTYTDACPVWDAVNVTTGATYGPKCIVFEAVAGKPTGLTLVWTPSFAGGDYNIKLN